MRLFPQRPVRIAVSSLLFLPFCFSQSTPIQVGDGATTSTIREEFLAAYQRGEFFTTVALPPLSEVVSFGSGGFRQEFQDAAKTGIRSALIRPAVPDLTLGVNNAVRQVRQPVYSVYTQSSVGVSTAGFPDMDTTRFDVSAPGLISTFIGGYYQTFDKGFGIFIWDQPPVNGGSDTRFNIVEPIYSRWKSTGFEQIGPPSMSAISATSRFFTQATYQTYTNGAIYSITSGTLSGRAFYVRRAVQDLYEANLGPSGFLGFPIGDEIILADGRRRQSFEGGTMEYAINGVPVLKNALQAIIVQAEDPIRLTAGQTITLRALLQTIAGDYVTDREVFWSTSNGRVVTIAGSGAQVTLRGAGGGTASVMATSEGKTSNRITVQVASQCCAIGEGAPTQSISQTFLDAIQRNRITVRLPVANPVRRVGAGYVQDAIALPSGNRVLIAKADASPVAYVVSESLSTFEAMGGPTGTLGFPVSDLSAGLTQRFENGALGGSPVRLVAGAILIRWLALGAEAGALGPPVASLTTAISFTGNQISSQQFRSGYLHQFDSGSLFGRAYVTTGAIAAKHFELGLAAGAVGAPITDEFLAATGFRQEFEGAFLDYSPGSPVRVIEKTRRPTLTISPASLLPGARYRVSIGGFPQNARLRLTQGSGAAQDAFDVTTPNGSFVWESIVPANARAGIVVLRATDSAVAQIFAEGSYTVLSLAELRPALTKLSGDAQSAAPATVLPSPIRVILKDSAGNPLAGVALRFEASPGAQILDATAATNADGVGEARLRLAPQAGVVLASVEAGGQIVTFSARAIEQLISDFPRITQAVVGNLGSSNLPLSQKGSLVAATAAVIRFFQQRGVAPADNGLADTALLNSYLRAYCTPAADSTQLCDGFLDPGAGEDPVANPFRALEFASGALTLAFPDTSLQSLREAFAANGPVIVGLKLFKNELLAGTHFVTITGILADGDLAISDPYPQFNLTRLSQYTLGFGSSGSNWRAQPATALQFVPRAGSAPAFYAFSTTQFSLASSASQCSRLASWPATLANLTSNATSTIVHLQACDGSAASYQASASATPYLLTLVSLGTPAAKSIVSGATPTAFRIAKSTGDYWSLSPEQIYVAPGSILNAADFSSRVAPGAIISVFGNGLPLSGAVANSVQLNGQNLPILFSNGFQLNTAVPASAPPGASVLTIRSQFGETTSPLELSDLAPGIFIVDSRGSAAALNQDSTLNTTANPAPRGQAIVLFATGLGPTSLLTSGLSTTTNPMTVIINRRELTPFFAGLAPGFIGLYQLNVILPANLPPGLNQSVGIRSGGADSNPAFISIR